MVSARFFQTFLHNSNTHPRPGLFLSASTEFLERGQEFTVVSSNQSGKSPRALCTSKMEIKDHFTCTRCSGAFSRWFLSFFLSLVLKTQPNHLSKGGQSEVVRRRFSIIVVLSWLAHQEIPGPFIDSPISV